MLQLQEELSLRKGVQKWKQGRRSRLNLVYMTLYSFGLTIRAKVDGVAVNFLMDIRSAMTLLKKEVRGIFSSNRSLEL